MADIPPIYALPSDELAHLTTPVLSSGTADAKYPVTNVVTMDPSQHFLTSSTSTAVDIDVDHGSATDVQVFSLHHHNIPAGTVCHLYRGASQGATTFDVAFTIGSYPNTGLPLPHGIDLTLQAGYSAGGWRWTRLHIPSLAQKVGIGSLMLWSTKRTDINNVAYPVNDAEQQLATLFRTSFGVKRGRWRGVRLRSHPCTFRLRPDSAYAAFLALFRGCEGPVNAFLWARDPSSTDMWLAGFSDDTLRRGIPYNNVNDVTTTIDELACGAALPTA